MKLIKYSVFGFGLLGAILALAAGILAAGGQGVFVLVACLLPAVLAAFGTVIKSTMPRWASIVSALSFLIVAMKTSQGTDFRNIMMTAVAGLLVSIALAVKPDRKE